MSFQRVMMNDLLSFNKVPKLQLTIIFNAMLKTTIGIIDTILNRNKNYQLFIRNIFPGHTCIPKNIFTNYRILSVIIMIKNCYKI